MNLYYGKNGLSKDVNQATELAKKGFERKMVKSSFAWGWIIFLEAIKTNDNSKITDCAYMFEQYGLYLLKSKDGICDDYLEIILEYFMYCYRQTSFQCFGYLSNDWLKIFKVAIERNMTEAYYLVGIDIVTHSDPKTIKQGLDYLDRASYSIKEACEFLTPKYLYGYSEIPADIEKAKKYAIQGYQLKSFKCAEHLAFMYCTEKISNGEDKSMMYGLILYHYYDCTHDENCLKRINEDIKADFRQGKALKKLRDMSQSERQKYYRAYIDFRIPE